MDYDRATAERVWLAITGGIAVVLVFGSIFAERLVYDRFIWQYFWGPVVADGKGEDCVARQDGETVVPETCTTAEGIVAEPGYTVISTASYGIVLVLLLIGVYFLAVRLDIGDSLSIIYALFPFVLLGGVLRTVEDASLAVLEETGTAAIAFPYSAILISPLIYFFMFALALSALGISIVLVRQGIARRYEYPLAGIGSMLLGGGLAYLGYLAVTTEALGFTLSFLVITLVGATAITAVAWIVIDRYFPVVNSGTGYVGAVIIWGHAVDGVANVLSLDWAATFDLPEYGPKHVINSAVQDITAVVQPTWLSDMIGVTWPFLPLKVIAAAIVVYAFNDELYDELPRYTVIMLLAVLAVGLGPGTRDMLRATFGI
ncbi:DUF63 family protein [Salinarchaeum sp. IM2453]|uniref:DUF63 family protein n=1 Tax=Salinarchaeum sp. IM2453 TaxID=2862870 RepID=UPI001C83EF3A|nr:DUF63 family protein [Salinarchaeum sp. IM2453]QZA88672.1 DUF63 family protein [Salinarchaeum sp. IM2453]